MKPDATIIIEDSQTEMPEWLKLGIHDYSSRLGKVQWIQNECRMGQIYSIDRAYSQVKTDYIFHCEDDWLFVERGFLRESKTLLEQYPKIIMVSLRGDTGWHKLIDWPPYPVKIAEPYWRGGWGGIAFNPGLRRLSDYKSIGSSYGKYTSYGTHGLGHELELSKMHLQMGYVIADLNRVIVQHIGGSRSRAIEPLPPMPKILIAVPACHKFDYGQWESEQSPTFNIGNAYNGKPYGTDIHISGTNPRIDVVRETWARDIEAFKSHVDLRFFYGSPHPRPALPDEVYIPCEDDYAHLPHKTVAICRWAVDNNYDYVFKCDDDTAVYVDRLIQELMTNRFDYAGFTHSNVCSGGPGYWLSKRAMKHMATKGGNPDHWAEDVWTGKIMGNSDIYPVMLPGHRPGFSQHWFFGDKFDASKLTGEIVAVHAVQPEVMREWYQHERKVQ